MSIETHRYYFFSLFTLFMISFDTQADLEQHALRKLFMNKPGRSVVHLNRFSQTLEVFISFEISNAPCNGIFL